MTDEVNEAPEETQDSPTDAAPVEDSPQPIVDWQKRAHDNQAWATRLAQEKSELEARLAEFDQAPPDSPDDEYEEYDFEDSIARQTAQQAAEKVAQLEAQLQQRQEHDFIDDQLESIEKEVGHELNEKVSNWIGRLSQEHRDQQGRPDVRAAYQEWLDVVEAQKESWVEGKRSDKPASGPGAVEVPDLDDPEVLADYIDRRMTGQ